MGYKADSVAQVLARNPITIGILSGYDKTELEASYSRGILEGMDEEFAKLEKYKIKKSFHCTGDQINIDEVMKWIETDNIEAVCLCSTIAFSKGLPEMAERLAKRGVPLFVEGGTIENPDQFVSLVEVDADISGRMAADLFYCMYGKDVRAAVLIGSLNVPNLRSKANGFIHTLENYGVDFRPTTGEFFRNPEKVREYVRNVIEREDINCIYDASSFHHIVCDELRRNGWQDRVAVIGTDYVKDATEQNFRDGILKAVIIQNERRIGKRIVRIAYDYLINSRTFGMEDWTPPKQERIKPTFSTRSCFVHEKK